MDGKGRIRIRDALHDFEVQTGPKGLQVTVDGETFLVPATATGVVVDAARGTVRMGDETVAFRIEEWVPAGAAAGMANHARAKVRAPMSGKLVEVRVQPGATVAKGDVLFVLEAMKMQNEVRSPTAGRVAAVQAKPGETLDTQRTVIEIEGA